jgi:hypothetical protein
MENNNTIIPKEVIGALADAFGKSVITIERWVNKNHDILTSEKAKEVFKNKNIEWPLAASAR